MQLPATITTTASETPIYPAYEEIVDYAPEDLTLSLVASSSLIGMDTFRADSRYQGIDGSGLATVILDTGIDLDHPFFGPDGNSDGVADRIVYHYDFGDNDDDASDYHDHGSNVSSIVASSDATYTGMAPGADIIHLKVFSNSGSGDFGMLENALQWVVANAAAYNIASVNMSLGDSENYSTAQALYGISDELAALAAANVIVVSASGNDFYTKSSVQGVSYPSADANSLSIGAVYDSNAGGFSYASGAVAYSSAADRITPFSQRHPLMSTIFAPGAPITGANRSGGTSTMHGTSQASPMISGIAVLAQQLALRELGRRLTMEEFASLLETTAVTVNDGDDENDNVTNTGLNFPRVDMPALAQAILDMGVSAGFHAITLQLGQTIEDVNFGNSNPAPSVESIVRTDADPTNAASVGFAVSFSEDVTGVHPGDFVLVSTGTLSGATIQNVSGSGTTYTVTVATGSGDGTIRLDLSDNDSIVDSGGARLGGTGTNNGDFTAGESYTIDKTPPVVTVDALTTTDLTPLLTGTVDDNRATVQVIVDGVTYPATNNGNGTWTLADDTIHSLSAGIYEVAVTATDLVGNGSSDSTSNELRVDASVVARQIFYNNSYFDDPDRGFTDDDAVAPAPAIVDPDSDEPAEWVDELGKTALLPGQSAGFQNYTSYSRGINGIMIDIAGLPSSSLSATNSPATSDFEFHIGNDNSPDGWKSSFDSLDPVPLPTVSVRPGAGQDSSDRVTLTWPDNAIENTWLQITVRATAATGLTSDDVFYFGNAIGDAGNSPTGTSVNVFDFAGVRDHHHNAFTPAPIHDRFDFNRDRNVNVHDLEVVKNNNTNPFNDLNLIAVPLPPGSPASFSSAIVGVMETVGYGSQLDTTVVPADESPWEEPLSGPVSSGSVVPSGCVDAWTGPSTNSDVNDSVPNAVADHLSTNTDLSTNSDGRIPSLRMDSSTVVANVRNTSEVVPAVELAHDTYARETIACLESSAFSTSLERPFGVTEPASVSFHEVAFGEIIEEEPEPLSSREIDTELAHDLAALMALRTRTSTKPASRDRALDNVLTEYMYYE